MLTYQLTKKQTRQHSVEHYLRYATLKLAQCC